jgi:hypothetical protein
LLFQSHEVIGEFFYIDFIISIFAHPKNPEKLDILK